MLRPGVLVPGQRAVTVAQKSYPQCSPLALGMGVLAALTQLGVLSAVVQLGGIEAAFES